MSDIKNLWDEGDPQGPQGFKDWGEAVSDLLAAPAIEVIDEVEVVGSAQATIAFENIPDTFKHLRLEYLVRSSASVTSTFLQLRLNSDSGDNKYRDQYVRGVGSNAQAAANTGANAGRVGLVSGDHPSDSADDAFSAGHVKLAYYTRPTARRTYEGSSIVIPASAEGAYRAVLIGGRWSDKFAINRVDLSLDTGDFMVGSVVTLYGLR